MSKFSKRFLVLAVVFIVCLITSNVFVPRLWQVGNTNLQLSGAVLLFPISYIINDLLTEVYGYKKSMFVIWLAFALSAFVAIMSALVCMLPAPIEEGSKSIAQSFNSLFMMVPRVSAASLLAFIVGSNMNAFVMSKMKLASKGKRFGIRAILSSIVGELADSLVFYPLAFWGIMSPKVILSIVFTQVSVKVAYEILVLPITSVLAKRLKQKEGEDTFDQNISYNPFKVFKS